MGVIDRSIAEASENDDGAGDRDGTGETFTTAARATPDTFLNEFDTSHIKLDDETVSRLLSMAVVVTNLLD